MKKNLLFLVFGLMVFSNSYGQGLCDTAYWNHTYLNNRLKIYDSCRTLTGVINTELPPALTGDGDYHIYVVPDTAYTWMISYRTPQYLKMCLGKDSSGSAICPTCLNVEEVCKGAPTDTGYDGSVEKSHCNGFSDTVFLPNNGEHVKIIGPFIYDTVHCWNEIHPVTTCVLLTAAGVNEINGNALIDGLKIYPQPASTDVMFKFDHAPHAVTLIKLYNITGQQLYVYGMSETSTLDVDVSSWPAGNYLYTIVLKDGNKILKSGKFSVLH